MSVPLKKYFLGINSVRVSFFVFLKIFLFYLRERERGMHAHKWGEGQRERLPSPLPTEHRGLFRAPSQKPMRSRLELKPRVGHPIDCTTQVPHPLLDCKMKR